MEKKISLPALGENFPSMEVETTHGIKNIPEDYKGKWFVLFSHPGDFTPVCTTEFESFAMSENEFKELNTELIGLSLDSVEDHKKWVEWINENAPAKINYPVIGGESANVVAKELGMVHEKLGPASVRAVFIVDDKGVLRLMMYYPMVIGRNISEIVRSVNALQVFDKYSVATPADYPNNKWLGENQVIVEQPSEEMKEAREAFDKALGNGDIVQKAAWLNHKKL
ncbi:MAG: peroxiredoxin [Clostridia bacterium]|nr:peroxiredoxin [Clostridia bacterium]